MSKKQETQKVIAVTSIKLNISGKEIEVTLDDARRLKAALEDLFREREKVTYVPYTPTPLPSAPWPPWRTTFGGNTEHYKSQILEMMKP